MARSDSDKFPRASDPSRALLRRARHGEREALGELLDQFRPSLNELARQLLSPALAPKVGASDLVQETCLDAMRDFEAARVRNLASMEAWLVTLLSNNLKDWQRKFNLSKKRDLRRERPLHDTDSKLGLRKIPLVSADSSPASQLMRRESKDLLQQALARLPRGYQQIIVWRTQERRTWQEISQCLDRSEDAVRMLWKRAIERLKRELRSRDFSS